MTIPEALEYLELTTPFTKSDLKKAYREALMVWHPDRFAGNDQLLAKAEVRTKLINDAFALLKEIPETDYPYQPLPEAQQPRKAMGPPPPSTPHQRKAPPAAAKSNAGSWFIVFAVLAVLGAAAFYKFQSSGAPEPEIVAADPSGESGHVIKKPDNTSALPQKTAASKDGTASAPLLPQTQPVEPPLPAAIPAKVPASMPVVTAQPNPAPAPPVTPPRSEIDLRLEALEQAFQIATERDAWKGYSDSMAALDKNYLAALERTLAAATSAGKLEDAIALRAEKQRLEKGDPLPTDQEEGPLTAAPMLKELRKTYRVTAGQYGAARNQTLHTLYDKYDQALAVFQTELTKAAKLDDALRVKTVRDRLAEIKATGMASPPVAFSSPFEKAAATTNGKAFTNSLGMKFVPVPGTEILICVHETRNADYAAFAAEVPGVEPSWKSMRSAPAGEADSHPVVNVSWNDAQAFCEWLSKKDGRSYRLPNDREWSVAVGVARYENEKAKPETLSQRVQDHFPWGNEWPPPNLAGNYADAAIKTLSPTSGVIDGYSDGFGGTAPVMQFKPNILGIYDLGGNVWEWVEDSWDTTQTRHLMRGACFRSVTRGGCLSSYRNHRTSDTREDLTGFRVALTASPGVRSTTVPAIPPSAPKTQNTVAIPFTNSLGMKFVPVPGTKVSFCIHETRKTDYAKFAAENVVIDDSWKMAENAGTPVSPDDDYPVVNVSWDDATAFCVWLSKKERKQYRLPADHEWSIAVGGLEQELESDSPAQKSAQIQGVYPWGGSLPPSAQDGNYLPRMVNDGYETTSPVMSFKPNRLGLFDLGGNVWEWCQDWNDSTRQERVMRGAAWGNYKPDDLLSSMRGPKVQGRRHNYLGFRCVAVDGKSGNESVVPTKPAATSQTIIPPPKITPGQSFTNSLGMKFAPVPGTKVLLCIHETRKADYAAYAATSSVDGSWQKVTAYGLPVSTADDHPVANVSWEDATAFCTWLSRKEGRTYRLPTDREWSYAVGIGRNESKDQTPAALNGKIADEFPWGKT
ncbi:MAG: SUMF1/EgtB/PvdO family nonheme iron enzyme, partial [Prosthecobacter sp.]|nr:SUMF1/EgtB/PvdO family nonheme iron enzyme [Prosthecobacter sp.]